MMFTAAGLVAAAWRLDLGDWLATGLRPEVDAQGATVYAFLGWQAFFVGVAALMGLYAVLRWLAGQVEAARPSTFELIGLFLGFTAGQGVFAVLLTRLFPGGGA
jgi:cytochrome c oxidase subunit I+III